MRAVRSQRLEGDEGPQWKTTASTLLSSMKLSALMSPLRNSTFASRCSSRYARPRPSMSSERSIPMKCAPAFNLATMPSWVAGPQPRSTTASPGRTTSQMWAQWNKYTGAITPSSRPARVKAATFWGSSMTKSGSGTRGARSRVPISRSIVLNMRQLGMLGVTPRIRQRRGTRGGERILAQNGHPDHPTCGSGREMMSC